MDIAFSGIVARFGKPRLLSPADIVLRGTDAMLNAPPTSPVRPPPKPLPAAAAPLVAAAAEEPATFVEVEVVVTD